MQNFIEFISQPWHWSISGLLIAFSMAFLLFFGRNFGVSSTYRTLCAMTGAGNSCSFFEFNWKDQIWNIVFVLGVALGGAIAAYYLASPDPVQISEATVQSLESLGVSSPQSGKQGTGFIPVEIFNFENLLTLKGIIMMVMGGFLVGFGTRWAGGCTSGHAISGLSDLQLPSFIAVIGSFIGGLFTTWILLPIILKL